MSNLLVLDGHSSAALAFTRSLGRTGHRVFVGSNRDIFSPASISKYCYASFEYPVSTENASDFADAVVDFVQRNHIDLLLPMTEWTTFPISENRTRFENFCKLALASTENLELSADKYRTIDLARSLGVPVPATWLIKSLSDLEMIPAPTFPLVVKDRYSLRWRNNRAVFGSVKYANSREELANFVNKRLEAAGDVLVQEFTAGPGVGFSCFALDGEVLLPFQWLRVREADPRGSASSSRKSVAIDPDILDFSQRLVAKSGFSGILMVEFKVKQSSQPVLMEINGRPWGSIQLPILSGINYPKYVVDWYLEGKRPPSEINYKNNVTCRNIVGELTHLNNLRAGQPANWPLPFPSFSASLLKISVPWFPGMHYDDFSFDDPKPGLKGISNWFSHRTLRRDAHHNAVKSKLTAKGIIHCHTTYSYDGKVPLKELCSLFESESFDFVALTEHTKDLSSERYSQLVKECAEISSKTFVVIPGLEFRSGDGVEIAGIGLENWLPDEAPLPMISSIRHAGGFSLWVHPYKKRVWKEEFLDCDAVEILNGKLDSTVAPNFSLLRAYKRQRQKGKKSGAMFGLDFHNLQQARDICLECQIEALTPSAIIDSLKTGRYISRLAHGKMSSDGRIPRLDYLRMLCLRLAFLTWASDLTDCANGSAQVHGCG